MYRVELGKLQQQIAEAVLTVYGQQASNEGQSRCHCF
jgi:hypothetical protein